jgi:hypothetical protein
VTQFGGSNVFECTPSTVTGSVSNPPNECVVIQVGPGTNTARCRERSSDPVVVQTCTITQSNGDNRAYVDQLIDSNEGTTQDGTQIANVMQDGGTNLADIDQTIRYSSTTSASTQKQDGHHRACVDQTATADNSLDIDQSQTLRADASASDPVTQEQDTGATTNQCVETGPSADNPNRNTLAHVEQAAGGGNASHVSQSHDFAAHGSAGASSVTQTQGSTAGGISAFVNQNSPGRAFSETSQSEIQHEFADTSGVAEQTQHGPLFCCTLQQNNPNDKFIIHQTSHQHAVLNGSPDAHAASDLGGLLPASLNGAAVQDSTSNGQLTTTGSGDIDQFSMNNADHQSTMCSTPPPSSDEPLVLCIANTSCAAADNEGGCTGSSATVCPAGTFLNTETGKCEEEILF